MDVDKGLVSPGNAARSTGERYLQRHTPLQDGGAALGPHLTSGFSTPAACLGILSRPLRGEAHRCAAEQSYMLEMRLQVSLGVALRGLQTGVPIGSKMQCDARAPIRPTEVMVLVWNGGPASIRARPGLEARAEGGGGRGGAWAAGEDDEGGAAAQRLVGGAAARSSVTRLRLRDTAAAAVAGITGWVLVRLLSAGAACWALGRSGRPMWPQRDLQRALLAAAAERRDEQGGALPSWGGAQPGTAPPRPGAGVRGAELPPPQAARLRQRVRVAPPGGEVEAQSLSHASPKPTSRPESKREIKTRLKRRGRGDRAQTLQGHQSRPEGTLRRRRGQSDLQGVQVGKPANKMRRRKREKRGSCCSDPGKILS